MLQREFVPPMDRPRGAPHRVRQRYADRGVASETSCPIGKRSYADVPMSRLIKLGFSGVRSFSPDEEQRLSFQTPITVILGANGTGKTTIVECLRLATIGELPPLVDKGAAFVHDPRLRNTSETKAKVRLLFEDALGRSVTVNRQFQLRLSGGGKHTFSTVETSLSIKDKTGQRTKTSNRCNDINAMTPAFLGVRQAVLENVIFVHQEDSLWPLQDPKKVKERFDDIFESRGYAKALTAIQKCAQQKLAELKILQTELERWRERLEALKQRQRDWRSMQARCLEWTDSLTCLEREMNSKLAEIAELEAERGRRQALRQQLEGIRDETRIRIEERDRLWRELGEELFEDTEELERILNCASTKYDHIEAEYRKAREERERIQQQMQSLREQEQNLQMECATLTNGLAAVERRKAACTELILEFQRKHQLTTSSIPDESVEQAGRRVLTELSRIQRCRESEIQQAERAWKEAVHKEQEVKLQNDSEREQLESLRMEIMALEKACAATAERLQAIPLSFEDLALATTRLTHLQAEKRTCDAELSNPLYEQRVATIRERLEACRRARTKLLYTETTAGPSSRRGNAGTDAFEEALRTLRDEEFAFIRQRLAQKSVATLSLADADEQVALREKQLSAARDRVIEFEVEARVLETFQRMEAERRRAVRQRLHELDQNLPPDAADVDGLKSRLASLHQDIHELEIAECRWDSRREWLDEIQKRMREHKTCPICDRPFSGVIEAAHAEATLNQWRVERNEADKSLTKGHLQTELEIVERQWRALEERAALTVQEKRSVTLIRQRERDFARVEAALASARADLLIAEHELAETRQLQCYAQRLTCLRQGESSAPRPSRISSDATDTVTNSRQASAETGNEGSERSASEDAFWREETELQDELDKLLLDRHHTLIRTQQLHERIQTTEAEIARWQQLQSDRERLEVELEQQRCMRSEKQARFATLERHMAERSATSETDAAETMLAHLKTLRSEEGVLRMDQVRLESQLQLLVQESKQYEQSALELAQQHLEECRQRIQQGIAEEEKTLQAVERAAGRCQSAEAYLRTVRDNLRYRRLNERLEQLQHTEKTLSHVHSTPDDHLDKDLRTAQVDADALRAKIHHLKGQRDLLEEQMHALAAELNDQALEQTQVQFQALRLQCDTIELASKDLRNYYRALDLAIMRYHDLKMRNINRVLRELWQNTYTGSDIDDIEIRSDVVADSLPSGRRTYHYRVVMRQGDTWLDMRGRCSAGQKVLACILIRLALAENFGNSCGVLALDEPTTNLDEFHVKSLASSLSMLIQQRATQRNFQLILITHEERFLEYLHIREHTNSYIYVARDRYGLSQIRQRSLDWVRSPPESEIVPEGIAQADSESP